MFCPYCGAQLQDGAEFCPTCGKKITKTNSSDNNTVSAPQQTFQQQYQPMSWGETLAYEFKHYADFNGRARRNEYWFFWLWGLFAIIPYLGYVWSIILLIPSLAVGARRLHDIGKSGFFLFLGLIPIVGPIILLVWFCTDSEPGDNKYGKNPKYIS